MEQNFQKRAVILYAMAVNLLMVFYSRNLAHSSNNYSGGQSSMISNR
jgi:hypothetical protein